jgi:predicted amidohydrolase
VFLSHLLGNAQEMGCEVSCLSAFLLNNQIEMKITVCAMSDDEMQFQADWAALTAHCEEHRPKLVLLPELPFSKWIASSLSVGISEKMESLRKYDLWDDRLHELDAQYVVYSRPVVEDAKYFNTAFLFEKGKGHVALHTKGLFPEEEHFYEQSCYAAPKKEYCAFDTGEFKIGVLLCTEMWFTDKARIYGKQGVDLLLCPRATGISSVPQWTRLGQTLAVISGAYCLSANKSGFDEVNQFQWGGNGWVAAPGNGELLGTTGEHGFLTVDIDLEKAKLAKSEYPLYVREDL